MVLRIIVDAYVSNSQLALDRQPFPQIRDLPGSSCPSVLCLPTELETALSCLGLCNHVPFPPQALHRKLLLDNFSTTKSDIGVNSYYKRHVPVSVTRAEVKWRANEQCAVCRWVLISADLEESSWGDVFPSRLMNCRIDSLCSKLDIKVKRENGIQKNNRGHALTSCFHTMPHPSPQEWQVTAMHWHNDNTMMKTNSSLESTTICLTGTLRWNFFSRHPNPFLILGIC